MMNLQSKSIISHSHFIMHISCIMCMCFSFQNIQSQSVVTAINDGPWDSAATWGGRIPGPNDRVIISRGVTVDITGNHNVDEVVVHGLLRVPENSQGSGGGSQGSQTFAAGSTRSGIDVGDNVTGTGYIMYSGGPQATQVLQRRFGIRRDASTRFIAVRFTSGRWQYNQGGTNTSGGWVNFTPAATDRLVATVDFSRDRVTAMNRQEGEIQGIAAGYSVGDLTFRADTWNGSFNEGEFFVQGTEFTVGSPLTFAAGNTRSGIDVGDNVTGTGYIMYSGGPFRVLDVQSRFGIRDDASTRFITVRFRRGRWQYNRGGTNTSGGWVNFTPVPTDRLVASVNFSRDTVTALVGSLGNIQGIASGYTSGDLTFQADTWNGSFNKGEFFVQGTEFTVGGGRSSNGNTRFPENRSLIADWVHVNSGGIFQIGTANNRFDTGNFKLTLTGTNPLADHVIPMANGNNMNMNNNDGFLMAAGGGRLQFFGEERLSFTKLSQTAEAGSRTIIVENVIERNFDRTTSAASDGSLNWEVGDEIVIASSGFNYTGEDVRTITRIQNLGSTTRLTLNRATTHRHYGERERYGRDLRPGSRPASGRPNVIDLRAEVALISRNILIKGLDAQDTDNSFGDRERLRVHSSGSQNGKSINGIGGHIMIMNTAGQTTVDGIQMDQMGQAGRLGRYPFHWHFGGDKRGDVLRNSSITNSNNRAVVVHGTDNVVVQGVVAHDVHGHGFFLESGVERGNRFEANIALGIHRIAGTPFIVDAADKFGDGGARFRTTAAYWITGANNEFVGNVAAGAGGSAFWIAQPDDPVSTPVGGPFERLLTSDSYLASMYRRDPDRERLGRFDWNTGHSMWTGLIVIPGGHPDFRASNVGRFRENVNYFNNVDPVFSNLTFYKTSTSLYPLVTNVTLQFPNFRAADNEVTLMDSDPMRIDGGLIVGNSRGNRQRGGPRNARDGNRLLQLYHGYSVFKDVHIAGYRDGTLFSNDIGDRHRPDANFSGISWEDDGSHSQLLESVGANRQYNQKTIYDVDGSLTSGIGGGAGWSIVTSFNNWIIDTNDGDRVFDVNGTYTALTRKRVGNLQLERRHIGPFENARWRMTNRQGKVYEMGGNASERDPQILINRRPRLQLVMGEEYQVDFPRGVDFDSEGVRFNFLQYSIPDRSQSVTLRFKGMANKMRPKFIETGKDLPRNSQLRFLRSATRTTYFPDPSSGDLFVKVFNRGVGVQSDFIDMVPINSNSRGSKLIGEKENSEFEAITIVPNPANEFIKLDLTHYMGRSLNFHIYDISGKLMTTGKFDSNHKKSEVIDLNDFSNGTYILDMQDSDNVIKTYKFVVLK